MRYQEQALQTELDEAMNHASPEWCARALRRLTDLFVATAARYSPEQIAIYDIVMFKLVRSAPHAAQVELSVRLADVQSAPQDTLNHLSRHADIDVARPVLEQSTALSSSQLASIAKTASLAHLRAIAARTRIETDVSDVIIDREEFDVIVKLLENHGASFSEIGFTKLIGRTGQDKRLGPIVASRSDVPEELRPFLSLALN